MNNKLEELRVEIDKINNEIISNFQKRFELTNEVALWKRENNIEIFHPKREKEMLNKLIQEGSKKGLDEEFVRKLFELVLIQSKLEQKKIIE